MNLIPRWRALVLSLMCWHSAMAAVPVDQDLPDYSVTSGVAGSLSSVGSDTLANLMSFWVEHFRHLYPQVMVSVQSPGSSSAPTALTESTANLGPMSRAMKSGEIEAFERRFGYAPLAIPVAIDALAIYVHKDNPLSGLTLAQIDGIFSSTLRCPGSRPLTLWGDLNLQGSWKKRRLQLYGRNSVSGTYGYFKQNALCKGDFRNNVNEQPGSASVVQAIATSLGGIGYSGIGYKTAGVRTVPVALNSGAPFVEASAENAVNQTYPLSRFLYIYVNKKPGEPLGQLEKEFIRMVLSREGQQIVVKDGYIPLPAETARQYLRLIER